MSERLARLAIGRMERHLQDGQRRTVVEVVDCVLEAGTCYALVGESGIGKTTALEMLALAQVPDVLHRFVFQRPGRRIDLAALLIAKHGSGLGRTRARHFGYVLQTSLLLPFLTVRENIEVTQKIAGRSDRAHRDALIDTLQLRSLVDAYPDALSGGQRQRVCLARALAHRPDLLLADEPTSSVDAEMSRLIMRTIREHADLTGATALVITHNVALVREFGLTELCVDSRSGWDGMRTTISSPFDPKPPEPSDSVRFG